MIRNWLSAAWGDLRRNPVQSFIAIGGLAVGLAAAILAGIVAMNQISYDDFVPGHQRLYFAVNDITNKIVGDSSNEQTPKEMANLLLGFPEVAATSRVSDAHAVFGRAQAMSREGFYWADPNFFRLMPVPVLYGDLVHALDRPDGVVLTLSMARKFFGQDDARGQTLEMDHVHPLTVAAVIADLPRNATNLSNNIFVSAQASFSQMSQDASRPGMTPDGTMYSDMLTLVQLNAQASVTALNESASALVSRFVPRGTYYQRSMHFERLNEHHLSPRLFPDSRPRLVIMFAAALATLILACVNFVNLSVARSLQRGLEVAVRKVAGASRQALIAQFLGESILQVLLALTLAVILVEWFLPTLNAFINSGAVFDYWRDPYLAAALLGGTVLVGIVAGTYPALILSGFRPVAALNGLMRGSAAGNLVRQGLVTLQFAALVVLLIAASIVFRQNHFATTDALRVDTNQVLLLNVKTCDSGLRDRIAALSGVRSVLCTSLSTLPNQFNYIQPARPWRTGGPGLVEGFATIAMVPVDFGFFEFYGVTPLAGRLFRPQSGDRIVSNPSTDAMAHYVINDAARRQLGFPNPQAAIGQTLEMLNVAMAMHQSSKPGEPPHSRPLRGAIVGVVPDFSLAPNGSGPYSNGGETPVFPSAYSVGVAIANNAAAPPGLLNIKLAGHDIPETLAAIDSAWKQSGQRDPIDRFFLDSYIQQQMITVLRQGQAFAVFAGIAMLLACLGLFGVALSVTARRTKEIGVRKAMGARDHEIVLLLLWQFSKPVVWANVIAWPLAWWAMNHWLNGFAYHVAMPYWLFPAAGVAILLIATLTVAGQAWLVARQKPVLALRYE